MRISDWSSDVCSSDLYATIVTNANYFSSLVATLAVAAATTAATLVISGIAGVFLQRHRFPGNATLVAMLTFPLAFPGVVIGFMVIMLAGRQGLIGDITQLLGDVADQEIGRAHV